LSQFKWHLSYNCISVGRREYRSTLTCEIVRSAPVHLTTHRRSRVLAGAAGGEAVKVTPKPPDYFQLYLVDRLVFPINSTHFSFTSKHARTLQWEKILSNAWHVCFSLLNSSLTPVNYICATFAVVNCCYDFCVDHKWTRTLIENKNDDFTYLFFYLFYDI
jgi:hypothetical protein